MELEKKQITFVMKSENHIKIISQMNLSILSLKLILKEKIYIDLIMMI